MTEAIVHERPHLLFLCHRIPYPPDKGDKIRSYQWLNVLVDHYRVHLGAFIDDPADWEHTAIVGRRCASSLFLPLPRWLATLRSLRGLLDGDPLTLPYYRDRRLRRWVEQRRATFPISHVLVYSSAMGQYIDDGRWSAVRRVVDFVDVDSDKWLQYAQSRPWPASWVYRREARRLAEVEARLARVCDASLLVSEVEVGLFRRRIAEPPAQVLAIPNGVDALYFKPDAARLSPFPPDREAVVFTGVMDYWANIDAVLWFVREVWPRVRAQRPQAVLVIVGSRPDAAVTALRGPDVEVTGRVPDVRPYVQAAAAVIAPMRLARGIQNKVLEGMAMARPVVVTSKGLEGIAATVGRDLLVADEGTDFAETLVTLLRDGDPGIGARARRLVESRYAWASATGALTSVLAGCSQVE